MTPRHGPARRPPVRRVDAVVAAALAGIAYASLARYGWIDCSAFGTTLLRESNRVSGSDLLGNVFAYLLLGVALGFAWLGRRPGGRAGLAAALAAGGLATLAGAALSLSMEAAPGTAGARHAASHAVASSRPAWPCAKPPTRPPGSACRRSSSSASAAGWPRLNTASKS